METVHSAWYGEADWWVAILTGALVLVTGALAVFTYRLWASTAAAVRDAGLSLGVAQAGLKHAERTSQTDLRAYVTVAELKYRPIYPGTTPSRPTEHEFEVKWINTGKTPARRMLCQISWAEFSKENLPNFDFPIENIENSSSRAILGPGLQTPLFMRRTSTEMALVQAGQAVGVLFAWAEYNDVFDGTPQRRTEACWLVERSPEGRFEAYLHSVHNGMDDDCFHKPFSRRALSVGRGAEAEV